MGTFHQGKHSLHGITVAVDTLGPEVYVGRCDDIDDQGVILLDADVHREGEGGRTKAEYLRRVAGVGHWKKHDRVVVKASEVSWVKPLGEIAE